jgi:hypothetical protein
MYICSVLTYLYHLCWTIPHRPTSPSLGTTSVQLPSLEELQAITPFTATTATAAGSMISEEPRTTLSSTSEASGTTSASSSITTADDYTDANASVSHHSSDAPVMSGSYQGIAAVEDSISIIESVPVTVQVVNNTQDNSRYCSYNNNTVATLQLLLSTRQTVIRRLSTTYCTYACYHMVHSTNFLYWPVLAVRVLSLLYPNSSNFQVTSMSTETATTARVSLTASIKEQPLEGVASAWTGLCKNVEKTWKQVINDDTPVTRISTGTKSQPIVNITKCGWRWIVVSAVDGG